MQDPDAFAPWTPHRAEELRTAAQHAARAVLDHAEAVTALAGRRDIVEVLAANERLARLLVAVSEAQFEFTGNPGPLALLRFEEDETEDEEDDEPISGISVVRRHDYAITDADAVLAAGRAAYLQVWTDDTDEDAVADVSHLGRALYQITHASGTWDSLAGTAGLRHTGASTAVVQTDALLGPDPDLWPESPFEVDPDQVIYRVSDAYDC